MTIHDATFFTDAQYHTPVKTTFFRSGTRARCNARGACVCRRTPRGTSWSGSPAPEPDRIDVAYHGVDTRRSTYRPTTSGTRVRATSGCTASRYLAFLWTLEPRKNVPNLIRGWVQAVAGTDDPPALVLAGGPGWDDEIEEAASRGASRAPRAAARLPAAGAARGFLGGAEMVAYPSLGEGFGLPVLEAMACGAAVLTTRRLSLPEVGGDAVAYTEPDPGSIADAIARACSTTPSVGASWRRPAVTERRCSPGGRAPGAPRQLRGGRRAR